jgi:hypothetical protein
MPSDEANTDQKEDNLRNNGRRRTILGGSLYDDGQNSWDCSITNISETGAQIRSDAALDKGAIVELKIHKFNNLHCSEIMWVRDGRMGLRFLMKIDPKRDGMTKFFKTMEG